MGNKAGGRFYFSFLVIIVRTNTHIYTQMGPTWQNGGLLSGAILAVEKSKGIVLR